VFELFQYGLIFVQFRFSVNNGLFIHWMSKLAS